MGSNVPKNTTQTTITDVPGAVRPAVTAALSGLLNLYGGQGAQPGDVYNVGYRQARERSILGSPVQGQANQMALSTLRGDYLNNPYLQDQFNAMARPITEQYQTAILPQLTSQFATGGRSYSPSMAAILGQSQDLLGRNLSEIGLGLTAQNYANERNIQNDVMKFAPILAQADYADPQMAMNLGLQESPENQMQANRYMQLLQAAGMTPQGGGSVRGPTGYVDNTAASLAGTALSSYLMYLMSVG